MTKFQEMRLRAVKFQEMTKCCMEIYGDADYILLHYHPQTGIKQPDFSFQMIGNEERFCKIGSPRPPIDSNLSIPESDWLSGIEKAFNARFPTLLEAQGWIAVEIALPEHAQNIAFYSQGSGAEFHTYYGYYDERLGGFVSHTDSYVGSPLYWKPLDQFPQP